MLALVIEKFETGRSQYTSQLELIFGTGLVRIVAR